MSTIFQKVFELFENTVTFDGDSTVLLFNKEQKEIMEDIKTKLEEKNYKFININKLMIPQPEDFNLKTSFVGPDNSEYKIKDLIMSDEKKRFYADREKLNEIKNHLHDNDKKTVLLIDYNEIVLKSRIIYETIRSWLKDGKVLALVYLSTTEKIRDFCQYGISIKAYID